MLLGGKCRFWLVPGPSEASYWMGQELYGWPKVAEAGRNALGLRYQLMPYLYTAFRHTAGHGCPLARPVFFGFPSDPTARDIDRQWLMGDSILVTPVVEEVRTCPKDPSGRHASCTQHTLCKHQVVSMWMLC